MPTAPKRQLYMKASQQRRPGGSTMSTTPHESREKDPICGMTVDPSRAAARSERDGKAYYFCSTVCKDRFDSVAAPEAHACCRRAS
jgi:YHS domain-containing protein